MPFFLLFAFSCNDNNLQDELSATLDELAAAKKTITRLQHNNKKQLVHIVFLKLKPNAPKEKMILEIQKLENIDVVQKIEVGYFKDLQDQRALAEYDLAFQVYLANTETYKIYQQHPTHLYLKQQFKEHLSEPPATYDFVVE